MSVDDALLPATSKLVVGKTAFFVVVLVAPSSSKPLFLVSDSQSIKELMYLNLKLTNIVKKKKNI